jgi:hypothetical protein
MNRRRVLTGLTAAGALLGVGAYGTLRWASRADADGVVHRLLAALRERRSAAAVGRAFLAVYPGERDAERLAQDIMASVGGRDPALAAGGTRDLRQAISRQIRRDFASSLVVSVDGWILSETEAKLCGLAALRVA